MYGLPGSGETSIINKLSELMGQSVGGIAGAEAAPTHLFNVNRLYWPGGTGADVKLTIFDFGGRETWRRSLWKSYYDQADALVWVVDSTDRKHLETCRDELLGMLDFGVLDGVCLLLYANKLDMEHMHPLDVNEIADNLEFNNHQNKILQERLWHIQSCSATTGDGLKDGMTWLVDKVKTPIQRDADFYYHRAAESRFCGLPNSQAFKDADEDLNKAVELSRPGRSMQMGRMQEPDRASHRELKEELERVRDASKRSKIYFKPAPSR